MATYTVEIEFSNRVVYQYTQEDGIWVSLDRGRTWRPYRPAPRWRRALRHLFRRA